jgi:(1->4)-alpha-D-glucan 1-alpha-D-glucosylmutase
MCPPSLRTLAPEELSSCGLQKKASAVMTPTIPRSTYRLQLTKDFTFADAGALAPYLQSLGISHAYLSPILKARPGSSHGYDTVDHRLLNPELGSRADFDAMANAFKVRGIGLVLDIVPNHMGIGGQENDLWLDVLKYGEKSRFADWFDINWHPSEPSLQGKVLVPFLGTSIGEALAEGKIELRYDEPTDEFSIWAESTHKLPVDPQTYSLIGDKTQFAAFNTSSGRTRLLQLMDMQHWRLARYSAAADDINYRRFFIVSDLAAIRIEREDVFDHVHRLTFELVAAGLVDGLRVDHVDGLYDPKAYCRRLREACPRPVYLVVEKILAGHEMLREDWGTDGTTGYEFASAATRLLTDIHGEDKLSRFYEIFTGRTEDPATIERDAKRGIMDFEMAAELDALSARIRRIAASNPRTADFTRNGLRQTLREVVAHLPVYRTYVDRGLLDERDRRWIAVAVEAARQASPMLVPDLFDFLQELMCADLRDMEKYDEASVRDTAQRIQQYTGPVMAKGLEDTALYRFNRFIALSDVGEKPDRFGSDIEAFHNWVRARAEHLPHGMLGSTTHDSKRGEDARARIAVLSGIPDEWADAVRRWTTLLQGDTGDLELNDLYYLYQLLLGSWPVEFAEDGSIAYDELQGFQERIQGAMIKSVREARLRTNWVVPRGDYEKLLSDFVAKTLTNEEFLADFRAFERRTAPLGAQSGLVETTLKLTIPGVPDIYQGAEFWEQSMVDPDNRRVVDFARRSDALRRELKAESAICWRDGRIKQRLIADLLAARNRSPDLFAQGTYEPVKLPDALPVIAFIRRHQQQGLLVVARLADPPAVQWAGGHIDLFLENLRSIVRSGAIGLELATLFPTLPVAVMEFHYAEPEGLDVS